MAAASGHGIAKRGGTMTSSRQCVFVGQSASCSATGYTGQLSQATLRTTGILAVVSLLFGAACAALISASLEQRLGNFLLFGLVPAICFYASGCIFCGALVTAGKLLELLATCCIRCAAGLVSVVFNRVIPSLSNRYDRFLVLASCLDLARVNALSQNAILSLRYLLRLRGVIYACACWTIRSVARFLISIEAVWQRG
jgi:hypothetical protein